MVIDDDLSDGEENTGREEDPKNNQKMQMTSILGGRERDTGKITESSKEEDEEVICLDHKEVKQQKYAANQSSANDKTRNLASFIEENEEFTLPLL